MTSAKPFLMFQHAKGREAIDYYVATVPGSRIVSMELFDAAGPGPEGTIKRGYFEVAGQQVMVHDSFIAHGFDFTPSWSFFLECDEEAEADRLFASLSDDGAVLMPLADYGWSRKFGWVSDKFGVSWQINWQ